MSKVDDELTRRLQRAERPVDGDGVFEGLSRRRSHRERLRKVQAGLLAFAVLAATGGGFVALRQAFDSGQRDTGGAPLSANGEIVFVREGDDVRLHMYAAQPDGSGVRQITEGPGNDSDPNVSPDGRTIAFAHDLDPGGPSAIATVPIDGGAVTSQSEEHHDVADPAWSPDGTRIAFVGYTTDTGDLYVTELNGDEERRILLSAEENDVMPTGAADSPAHPSWSPDGTRITVAVVTDTGSFATSWDLAIVGPDGTGLEWLVATDGVDEEAPAWSPDGSRIAFLRPGNEGHEVWTVAPDGSEETLIATAVEATLSLDLDWAPDGSSLLVSDGDWIYRVDATPEGDVRDNFVQLMRGFSPSWQPIPLGSSPSATASPEPSPQLEGRDIGLRFNVCNLERLGGIDFLGDGTQGQAWTGARVNEKGTCPDPSLEKPYLVAADVDGDGVADAASETVEYCFYCRPFDAVDLDADGDDELVVLSSEGSTPTFMVYDALGIDSDRRIDPVLVAEPGNPAARHEPDRPLTFSTGGDEGYSGWVQCEDFPAAPVLVITWRDHPIEGDTMEVHETRFVLEDDGLFHVVGTNDYSAPVGEPIPGVSDEPACGVDWQILG